MFNEMFNRKKILLVIASFIIFFVCGGINQMSTILIDEAGHETTNFSEIATQLPFSQSFMASIPLLLSLPVTILIEIIGLELITIIGTVIVLLSLIIAGFCIKHIWILYVIFGGFTSCGVVMCTIPAYLIISFHSTSLNSDYDKCFYFLTGIAISGSGIGGNISFSK